MAVKLLKEVEPEVTNLLSDLIRINTTNPPGNETEAAKYLAETLEKEGLKCEILESAPGRGNVITRIRGTGEKPSLLLLSHLDVVPANPKEWSVNPFGGVVKDGFVWGKRRDRHEIHDSYGSHGYETFEEKQCATERRCDTCCCCR